MARKIDWNKRLVKAIAKKWSAEEMDDFNWYVDDESDEHYSTNWTYNGNRHQATINKLTNTVSFRTL